MLGRFKKAGKVVMDIFTKNPGISEEDKTRLNEALESDLSVLVPTPTGEVTVVVAEVTPDKTAKEQEDTVEGLRAALAAATIEKDGLSAQLTSAKEEAGKYKADADEYAKNKDQYQILSDWHKNYKASVDGVVTPDANGGDGKAANGGLSEKTVAAMEEKARLKAEYPDMMKGL